MRKPHITPGFPARVKSWLTGKYVENGSTASQNIPAGKWVTWKGQIYRSKLAITTGDTLSSANLEADDEGSINATGFLVRTYTSQTTSTTGRIVINSYVPSGYIPIAALGNRSGSLIACIVQLNNWNNEGWEVCVKDNLNSEWSKVSNLVLDLTVVYIKGSV